MASLPLASHVPVGCDFYSRINSVSHQCVAVAGYGRGENSKNAETRHGNKLHGAAPLPREGGQPQRSTEKQLRWVQPPASSEMYSLPPPPPPPPVNSSKTPPATAMAAAPTASLVPVVSRSEAAQQGRVNSICCYGSLQTWPSSGVISKDCGRGTQQVQEVRNMKSSTNDTPTQWPNSYSHDAAGGSMYPYGYSSIPVAPFSYFSCGAFGQTIPQACSSGSMYYGASAHCAAAAAAVSGHQYNYQHNQHNYYYHHHHYCNQNSQPYYQNQSQHHYAQHQYMFHHHHQKKQQIQKQQQQQNTGMDPSLATVCDSANSSTEKNGVPTTEALKPVRHAALATPDKEEEKEEGGGEETSSLPRDHAAEGPPLIDGSEPCNPKIVHEHQPLVESDSTTSRRCRQDHTGGHIQTSTTRFDDVNGSSSVKSSWGPGAGRGEAATFTSSENILGFIPSFSPISVTPSQNTADTPRRASLPSYHDAIMTQRGQGNHSLFPHKTCCTNGLISEPQEDLFILRTAPHKRENNSKFSVGIPQEPLEYEEEIRASESTEGVLDNGWQRNMAEGHPRGEPFEASQIPPVFASTDSMRALHHQYHHCYSQQQQQQHKHYYHDSFLLQSQTLSTGLLNAYGASTAHQRSRSFNAMTPTSASFQCPSTTQASGVNRINANNRIPLNGASITMDSGGGGGGGGAAAAAGSQQTNMPDLMWQNSLPLNNSVSAPLGSKGEGYADGESASNAILRGTPINSATVCQNILQAPLYEHCGAQEVLFEERDTELPFDSSSYGNIVSFIYAVSPVVEMDQELEWVSPSSAVTVPPGREKVGGDAPSQTYREPSISLANIWKALDFPFACRIPFAEPASLAPMRPPQKHLVYVPFFSGFRLRFLEKSATYAKLKSIYQSTDVTSPTASHPVTANRTTHMQSSFCDGEFVANLEVSAEEKNRSNSGSSSVAPTSSKLHGATQENMEEVSHDAEIGLLTWGATERPDQRSLLLEQVHELAASNERYSVLLSANTTELDNQSWFAVLWQPVYDQCHTAKHGCGSFIVYYALRPPRHVAGNRASSVVTMMNGDWLSPVFRCDREGVHWEMWTSNISTPMSLPLSSLVSPSPCEGNNDNAMRAVCMSLLEKAPFASTGSGGEMQTVMETSSASMGSHDTKFSPSGRSCAKASANEVFRNSQHAFFSPSSEKGSTYHGTVRIPVVGIIPSRCRADVWFLPCPRLNSPESNAGRNPNNSGTSSLRRYRAPLFLLTAALQLMSWNALEGFCRQAMRKKGLYAVDKNLDVSQDEVEVSLTRLRGDTTTTTTSTVGASSTSIGARLFLTRTQKTPSGRRLLVEGARGYRHYRESVNADAGMTSTTPVVGQESIDHNGSPISSPTAAGTDVSAIVEGLPDFYQWVQFDAPLLNYAELYA
ncbi:hypothetical protein C3747_126g121 [Trypanosoma cruzi]|uniref:Uncharacterized protein n=2 Tax=Trypanosoma cruzi TaxID=5693 RepID=Q4DAC8_TRYCC|nr:hypothetical protein, conserved [Trypanosoma cruzi]EAN89473.1 hypothetical protein, conserved [Trypanosoma cruzi]PWV05664.1 hypothetical protein C3747_126g121 [Trypanosoma cruzi]RNC45449.1 hypothetical protein TcCL_NonESM04788 [Trypanosoma cruzi]|eukprot:XP_811324.1 hypothetical protein [Trypanosoma cruzi strain CL Brener]